MNKQRDELGRFLKGFIPWIKGKKHSEESLKKISKALKGRSPTSSAFKKGHKPVSPFKKGQTPWNKGLKLTKEQLKNYNFEGLKNGRAWNKGKHNENCSKEKHWNWKGGISSESKKIWCSLEYKMWRKSVFERDNYECQVCGYDKGAILEAHHIKTQREFPKLRFNIKNGITLCKNCHKKEHYGKSLRN